MERTVRGNFIRSRAHLGEVEIRVDDTPGKWGHEEIRLTPHEARSLGMKLICDAQEAEQVEREQEMCGQAMAMEANKVPRD